MSGYTTGVLCSIFPLLIKLLILIILILILILIILITLASGLTLVQDPAVAVLEIYLTWTTSLIAIQILQSPNYKACLKVQLMDTVRHRKTHINTLRTRLELEKT